MVETLPERVRLAAQRQARVVVALHAPNPVVESVLHIARPAVRVAFVPRAEQHFAHVGLVVAFGRFEKQRLRRMAAATAARQLQAAVNDDAAVCERDARRNAQLVREHGELVCTARSLGILADDDFVASLTLGLQFIGIIHRDGAPEPAAFVPGHADWLTSETLFVREQFDMEPFRRDHVFYGFFRRQGPLHLAFRLALSARLIVGDLLADVVVLERFGVWRQRRHFRNRELGVKGRSKSGFLRLVRRDGRFLRFLTDGPADAAFEKSVKAGIAPGAFIVTPRRVEDAPLALRAHPRPRFLALALHAIFQNGAIFLIVFGMDVGFVPTLEAFVTLHDRMIRRRDDRAKRAGVVALELRADERDVLRRIEEAVGGAMDGDEALAALDVIEQRFLLIGADLGGVGVDEQAVISGQRCRIERLDFVGILHVDTASGHDRLNLLVAILGIMMAVVAKEENFDGFRLFGGRERCGKQ